MKLNAIGAVLAINVLLVAALAYLWTDDSSMRWAEPAAIAPSLEDIASSPAPEPVEISRYRETVQRPLFAANRRIAPRSDTAGGEAESAVALKDVRLLGTYAAGGKGGLLIVSGGKVQRVPIGGSIGEWKVVGEEGRGAVLVRRDGERRRLELALDATTPPPPAGKPGEPTAAGESASGAAAAATAGRQPASATTRTAADVRAARLEARRKELERFNARRAQELQRR